MIRNHKLAATFAIALAIGVVTVSMWVAHSSAPARNAHVSASALEPIDEQAIEKAIRSNNLPVANLTVRSAGGIVILRGNSDPATAEQAVSLVKSLGPQRVANLITPQTPINDEALRREAERYLALTNSLDGCRLHVACDKGVVTVTGTVQHELQKDAARNVLRAVRGVKDIKVNLTTM